MSIAVLIVLGIAVVVALIVIVGSLLGPGEEE